MLNKRIQKGFYTIYLYNGAENKDFFTYKQAKILSLIYLLLL